MGEMGKSRSASKDLLVIVSVGFCSLLISILIGVVYETPAPKIHDEFAYLLSADTFAAGRLTNPTHPMWPYFETFHVFHMPTYQSKYPPGQGLFLALGQVLADWPILGIWISLALAYSATCWMLLAVFPRSWALYGTMLAIAHPNLFFGWGQTYWGGAVAMLGGALLLGAVFRFQQKLTLQNAVMLGLGVAILANSRPYEGLITCCAVAPIMVMGMRQWILAKQGKQLFWKFVLPFSVACLVIASWILFYNYSLTSNALVFPHSHWHEVHDSYRGTSDLSLADKLSRFWSFFVGPILSISILGFWYSPKEKKVILSLGVMTIVTLVTITQTKAWPHYLAPISCLIFVIIVHGFKSLQSFQIKGRPWGQYFVIAITALYFMKFAVSLSIKIYNGPRQHWAHTRSEILQCLKRHEPKDLIIVRYDTDHNRHREWVYNRADIDHAEVVWARELSLPQDKELLAYFNDRQVWLLLADQYPPHLLPYPDTVANDDAVTRPPSFDIESCIRGT